MSTADRPAGAQQALLRDVVVVFAWYAVLGLVAAVVWWRLTPLAEFTLTDNNAQMGEDQLGRQVSADGWFFVIAAVGGLLSGIALIALRRRDPVAMVVLVTLGALLACWIMVRVGLWLGPADPRTVLADADVGDKVPMQLKPQATGVYLAWPITTLLGAVGVLWGTDTHHDPPAGEQTWRDDGVSTTHSG